MFTSQCLIAVHKYKYNNEGCGVTLTSKEHRLYKQYKTLHTNEVLSNFVDGYIKLTINN